MNKYLLSLFFFGYAITNQLVCNAQSEGGEDGGEGEGVEDSSTATVDTSIEPNYAIDYFYITSEASVPWPYPVETCVLTSLISSETAPYVIYSCTSSDSELTKQAYSDSDCSTTSGDLETLTSSSFTDSGDINSFVCGETDNYSFKLSLNCNGDSTSDTYAVPGVCFRDSEDTQTGEFSNYFSCTDYGNSVSFDVFTASSFCGVATDIDSEPDTTSITTVLDTDDCVSFWNGLVTSDEDIFAELVVGDSLKCYSSNGVDGNKFNSTLEGGNGGDGNKFISTLEGGNGGDGNKFNYSISIIIICLMTSIIISL